MGLLAKIFGLEPSGPMPVHITDANFKQEVLGSDVPVLLDVWGPDCVHCKRLEPVVIRLTRKYHGKVKVTEMNAAEAVQTARKLGVRGTPTVVYFARGREVERVVGFRGELYHSEYIDNELLGDA